MREYLNTTFIENSFSDEERYLIKNTNNESIEYSWDEKKREYLSYNVETEDYVFLLSQKEVERFFPDSSLRNDLLKTVHGLGQETPREYRKVEWGLRDRGLNSWLTVHVNGEFGRPKHTGIYLRASLNIDLTKLLIED